MISDQKDLRTYIVTRLPLSYIVRYDLRKASENQPDEGAGDWISATLEECLEALSILLVKAGAKPSDAFSFWRLARAN